jgi:hypothetical protein
MSAKILLLDIETSPAEVYAWGIYDQNIPINHIKKYPNLMCWAAKWADKKKVYHDAQIYHKSFKKDNRYDKEVCKSIWKLLDDADIVIAHNGDRFDIKRLNTFFVKNDMLPPSPFRTIDTLKTSRSNFGFISNKLDALCRELELGSKLEHEGFRLWEKCLNGDKKAWKKMISYNMKDVKLLELYYEETKPFIKRHPSLAVYEEFPDGKCPNCLSTELVKDGFDYTSAGKRQTWQCKSCGKYCRSNQNLLKGKGLKQNV